MTDICYPCLDPNALWTVPYNLGNIQTIAWRVEGLQLSVLFRSGLFQIYGGVSQPVAQRFPDLLSGDAYYQQAIATRFIPALCTEDFCPIQTEDCELLLCG